MWLKVIEIKRFAQQLNCIDRLLKDGFHLFGNTPEIPICQEAAEGVKSAFEKENDNGI